MHRHWWVTNSRIRFLKVVEILIKYPAGPGVGPRVAIGEELGMVVNTKGAGKGKVSCMVVQPDGSEVEAEVLENEDGTFDIFYTAPAPGNYVIYVRFGGENIPHSPFNVMVSDWYKVNIYIKHFSS